MEVVCSLGEPEAKERTMKILVAYDGSSYSDKALDRALEAAKKFAAELTVLLAVPPLCIADLEMPGETCQRLEEALDKEAKKTMAPVADRLRKESVAAKTLIQTGDPAELILDVADSAKADLIILGNRGRHGAKRLLLGSVSGKVSEYAKCDVWIVR
jgi:nucleotide-binding universal stress UspA family protein